MGLSNRHRGFSDENLFMAMTSQPKIAGMDLNDCQYVRRQRVCKLYSQKWTYAIPLEIIYLTPLSAWNPYNLQFKGHPNSKTGREVTEGMKHWAIFKAGFLCQRFRDHSMNSACVTEKII